jgi:hypothetical protein
LDQNLAVKYDKPVDKNNHAINALEWITMELPADPNNLIHGIYNRHGENLLAPKKKPKAYIDPFADTHQTTVDSGPFNINF